MRHLIALPLVLVACGPSKAEIAAQSCDRALSRNDYESAAVYCRDAMRLNRADATLRAKWERATRLRGLREFAAMEERERQRNLLERQVLAAEREAAAMEDLAAAQRRWDWRAESSARQGNREVDTTLRSWEYGTTGLGGTTFHRSSDGTRRTARGLGGTTFYDDNSGLSGTTIQVGRYRFHDLDNGVSGTSMRIGNFTLHDFSDGRHCTTSHIGSYAFTDCN